MLACLALLYLFPLRLSARLMRQLNCALPRGHCFPGQNDAPVVYLMLQDGPPERSLRHATSTGNGLFEMLSGITNRGQYEHLSSIEMAQMRTQTLNSPMAVAPVLSLSNARTYIEYVESRYMRPTFGGPD
jgi:hypothetical protein